MTLPLLESVDDILAKPDPTWLIRHIIPMPGLTLLYGPSGQGKSFVALDWALSVASSTPWLSTYPIDTRGAVVYIACEGTGGLKRRISAWREHHPDAGKLDNAAFCLKQLDLYDSEERQRLLDELGELYPPLTLYHDEDGWVELREQLKLIVVDTVARVFQGDDENDNAQMSEFIRAIEEFATLHGAAVVLVHHSAKASARNERGGGALRGAMDACYMCQGKKKDGRLAEVALVCNKMKDADERTVLMEMDEYDLPSLSCDEDGKLRHGGALRFIGTGEEDEASGEASGEASEDAISPELATLDVLRKHPKGLTLAEWQAEAGISRMTLFRHRELLEKAGHIGKHRKNPMKWKTTEKTYQGA